MIIRQTKPLNTLKPHWVMLLMQNNDLHGGTSALCQAASHPPFAGYFAINAHPNNLLAICVFHFMYLTLHFISLYTHFMSLKSSLLPEFYHS